MPSPSPSPFAPPRFVLSQLAVAILSTGLLLGAPGGAQAEDPATDPANDPEILGAQEYRRACSSCHGEQGRGDGPMAEVMTFPPADLSRLAIENDGEYPFWDVYQVIDGRKATRSHGGSEMPIWGDFFNLEAEQQYGPYSAELVARTRIIALVYYIQSLQRKD